MAVTSLPHGLGGLFAMVSLQPKQRRLRRHGVLCRVSLIDVPETVTEDGVRPPPDGRPPTAVHARVVARRRLRVRGPPQGLALRCGRFRRGYSDELDGPYTLGLGWGVEQFVDDDDSWSAGPLLQSDGRPEEWSAAPVQVLPDEAERVSIDAGVADSARALAGFARNRGEPAPAARLARSWHAPGPLSRYNPVSTK